ncbi:uncharacterized protein PFLUO_LOCUS4368 [Penicillium psychrofluorescens]|uniref:uncharacterized protein n=1 Tax=Penicillium psychrofluorescens TaxID=3158075 RepID=UPI003CCE4C6D
MPHIKRSATCTVGLEYDSTDIPGGDPMSGAGASTAINNLRGFFGDEDGSDSYFPVEQDGEWYHSNGTYNTSSGSTGWYIRTESPMADDCIATYGPTTFDSKTVNDSICHTYSGGAAFTADYGCLV